MFTILTSWLRSPDHSGFRLQFNSAFRVSSSTERAVFVRGRRVVEEWCGPCVLTRLFTIYWPDYCFPWPECRHSGSSECTGRGVGSRPTQFQRWKGCIYKSVPVFRNDSTGTRNSWRLNKVHILNRRIPRHTFIKCRLNHLLQNLDSKIRTRLAPDSGPHFLPRYNRFFIFVWAMLHWHWKCGIAHTKMQKQFLALCSITWEKMALDLSRTANADNTQVEIPDVILTTLIFVLFLTTPEQITP